MNQLILVHRGNHNSWNPIDWEWVRIWNNLKVIVDEQWISLQAARILAVYDDGVARDTSLWIRSMNITADQFKTPYEVPEINIFSALPYDPYDTVSHYAILVTKALVKIRNKIQELWTENPIIIVWSLPPIWWIAQRLWRPELPEFRKENYTEAAKTVREWVIYVQEV